MSDAEKKIIVDKIREEAQEEVSKLVTSAGGNDIFLRVRYHISILYRFFRDRPNVIVYFIRILDWNVTIQNANDSPSGS